MTGYRPSAGVRSVCLCVCFYFKGSKSKVHILRNTLCLAVYPASHGTWQCSFSAEPEVKSAGREENVRVKPGFATQANESWVIFVSP